MQAFQSYSEDAFPLRDLQTSTAEHPDIVTSTPSENGEKNGSTKQISSELVPPKEAESNEQDEKLAEYLEHLDVLDNPNVVRDSLEIWV